MSASAPFRDQDSFIGLGEIVEQFPRVFVVYDRADRNPNLEIFATAALPITAFTVPATLRPKYVVEAELEKCVFVRIRDEINTPPVAAIAAARAALWNELFSSERD